MSETPQPQYLQPGTWIGPYEVVWLLGTGGYGAVYKVRQAGALYALKLSNHDASELPEEHRRHFEQRAQREYDVLAQLAHPNIVRVHRFDWWPRAGAFPYLVMDFIEGLPFHRWIVRERPPLWQVVESLIKVARALAELHRRGICHRDLKGENLMVRSDGEPVLIDLGLALADGATPLTGAQSIIGTYKHWAPEYAAFISSEQHRRGERFRHQPSSDLHALGYLLYEVLAGRAPFSSDDYDFFGLLHEIREVVPPHPCQVNPGAPPALAEVAMRLLAKDPAARPYTGDEVARLLEQVLWQAEGAFDAPLEAPPPPPREGSPSEWRTHSTLTPETYGRIMAGAPVEGAGPRRRPLPRPLLLACAVLLAGLLVWLPLVCRPRGVEATWSGDMTSSRTPSLPPKMLNPEEAQALSTPDASTPARPDAAGSGRPLPKPPNDRDAGQEGFP